MYTEYLQRSVALLGQDTKLVFHKRKSVDRNSSLMENASQFSIKSPALYSGVKFVMRNVPQRVGSAVSVKHHIC